MKKLFISFLLLVFAATPAFSFNFNLYDFGNDPFDSNNNWSPIDYPSGIGHQPSPGTLGEGGEKFDLEGLNVAVDDDYVYIALANSFGYTATSTGWNQEYRLGDLFIGIDGVPYQYAIDLVEGGTNGLYAVGDWTGIQNVPGSYYGTSIANQVGAHEMTQGSWLGDVTSVVTFWDNLETDYLEPGNGDTYVWEFRFDKSLLGDFQSLDFHIALGCGNDLIEKSFSPVPEPTSMLLFGLGLVGSLVVRRSRKKTK